MDKPNEYDDINIDQENDELETELDSEQVETEESESDDSELQRLRSENKKLTEIIKRRKERDEKTSTSTNQSTQTINTGSGLTREEAILIASGMTEEDLNYLNLVAKGAGLPISEAKEHPLFQTYLQKIEDDKKAKRAKLGVSKGSSVHRPKSLAGVTEADHRKAWEERFRN